MPLGTLRVNYMQCFFLKNMFAGSLMEKKTKWTNNCKTLVRFASTYKQFTS